VAVVEDQLLHMDQNLEILVDQVVVVQMLVDVAEQVTHLL
tara:strand:+ start:229 stop:348 length:120 start_codon:yes stop_codon:yes gene_type:complete